MQMLAQDYAALQKANVDLVELSKAKAQAEYEYSVAIARRMLELKTEGNAISMLKDLTRGDPAVAAKKQTLDIADASVTACREAIRNYREHLGVLRSLLTWQRAELQAGHAAPF